MPRISRSTTGIAAATLTVSAGYRWAVRRFFTEVMRRIDDGDTRLLMAITAPDVHFTFPGTSSFSIDTRDRAELDRWLHRTASIGLVHTPQEILLSGPPWNLMIVVRLTDQCAAPDGRIVYDNIAVIVARTKWGRLVRFETFLDMDRVPALDDYVTELN